MADERDPVAEAALAAVARHALHDEELVAGYAAGGLDTEDEAAQARALIDRCAVCRDLHRDMVAIGVALKSDARIAIPAPRDFRLSVEDAHRLGGRVVGRGFRAALRRSFDGLARPVGATLATLGLVGVLVGSVALGGGAMSAPFAATSGAATNAPAEIRAGGTPPEAPKASSIDVAYGPAATGVGATDGAGSERDLGAADTNPIAWLLGGSIAMLVAGLVLLLIALRRGRRAATHP